MEENYDTVFNLDDAFSYATLYEVDANTYIKAIKLIPNNIDTIITRVKILILPSRIEESKTLIKFTLWR